ncbi:MAG: alanine--glyoxylate aminotransferase family protein [Chloroflexi bacterium]|nr:alanine--glyoxylate aminotransferase family protein [Chloroflexota bacterium]
MNLRIPGPTPCPDEILEAMGRQMINHRGPEFQDMLFRITEGLKHVYQTRNDVFILTGAGTGSMEAAIVNTLSPGDQVLSVSIGVFGDRFAQIAEAYGASVVRLSFPWGRAIDPEELRRVLKENPSARAVLVTHNETSTGVTNDMALVSKIVKEFDKLLLVDAISSLSSLPFYTDEWDCDIAISGSQKGWNVPPGLSFASVSPRAWDAFKEARMPRFYWDFGRAKTYFERGQTPWTPAVSIFYALEVSLKRMLHEGLESIYQRHARTGQMTRDGVKGLGLEIFADEEHASNTVTAVNVPSGVDGRQLVRQMQSDRQVVLAGGQSTLEGKIVRIGHLGYVTERDISNVLESLEAVLPKVGFQPASSPARG